jgi:hypothetical protein
VLRQLAEHLPEGFDASDAPFKFIFPSAHGALGPGIYVVDPDLAKNDTPYAPCESLALVGEMTSTSTRGNDLTVKLEIYADPSERGYQTQTTVAFGKPVRLPEPFDFELDTSAFTA